jgi:O-antigen/teichoic acid export membrane protein
MKLMALSALVVKAYPIITAPLFLYLFTKEEFGGLDYAYYVMSLGCILLTMGVHNGYARYALDEAIEPDIKAKKYSYLLVSASLICIVTSISVLIIGISGMSVSDWIPMVLQAHPYAFSFYIVSGALAYTSLTAERFSLSARSLVAITSIIYIFPLLALIVIYYFFSRIEIHLILLVQIVFNFIAFMISLYASICKVDVNRMFVLSRRYVTYSFPLLFALVSEALINFSGRLFLAKLYPDGLGDFAIASRVASVSLILNFFISFIFHPIYYRDYDKESFSSFWEALYSSFIVIYCLLIIIVPGIITFAFEYLNKPLDVNLKYSVFLILTANLLAGLQIFHLGMHVKEKTSVVGLIYLVTIPVAIFFNFILINQYLLIGAGLAMVVTMMFISIPYIYFSNKVSERKLKLSFFAKIGIALASVFVLFFVLGNGSPNSNLSLLFAFIATSLLIITIKSTVKKYYES